MALMSKAQQKAPKTGEKFKAPDVRQFVPEAQRDAVERIVAAGVKFMYSPQAREQVQQDIARQAPVPQKLAESTLGLMLTLDQQAKGGLPAEAMLPAGMELLGEAGEILSAAGELVTQEDYNEAARMLFVGISRKLGMNDDDILGIAEQAANQAEGGKVAPGQPSQDEPIEPQGGDVDADDAEAQAAWNEEQPR
jgi:hypothetical protein